jgi:O-antigen/teichoic acid export membrane protein
MDSTKRIIVNTVAQYIKAVFTTCLALYSTRLVLDALSVSDFGIYAVVGGVVALLGFITNALIITTQRYISYYHGQGEMKVVRKFFCNSLFLHIVLGVAIALVLISVKGWLFQSFLNIDPGRVEVAQMVYLLTIGMLLLTILTAPFKALFIARENIVFIAVVDSFDAILKLAVAIGLFFVTADKLLVYALLMLAIFVLNFLIFSGYALTRFEESTLLIRRKDVGREYLLPLVGFAGWTTFGMGAAVVRTQGHGFIFNHFCGTIVNAAYGISLQVFSAISVIVTSILNAMNPQIMKSEGLGDRGNMLRLAFLESKYSTALLTLVAIPLIAEMPAILSFWLKEVPAHTVMFCRYILIAFICDQATMGLHSAIQAIGKLRTYSLLVYTPKILNLPMAWWLLTEGMSLETVMIVYLSTEIAVALVRIPFLRHAAGMSMRHYVGEVVMPLLPLVLSISATAWLCTLLHGFVLRFAVTFVLSMTVGGVAAWIFTLNRQERAYVGKLLHNSLPYAIKNRKSISH